MPASSPDFVEVVPAPPVLSLPSLSEFSDAASPPASPIWAVLTSPTNQRLDRNSLSSGSLNERPPPTNQRLRRNSLSSSSLNERSEAARRIALVGDSDMQQLTCFCPALSLWELIKLVPFEQLAPAVAVQPAAWSFDAALLFVDISGFTNMCTKISVDCLQSHINRYLPGVATIALGPPPR
jgi:hypothetical protein